MKHISRKHLNELARELWYQRERSFAELMWTIHKAEYKPRYDWDTAPAAGKRLVREDAKWLYDNGLPNDYITLARATAIMNEDR